MVAEILILRSGRHLGVAIRALRDRYPGCRISVVAQPGVPASEVPADHWFIYADTPAFQPIAFRRSVVGRQLARQRFDVVAVLWGSPDGAGFENVSRTAIVISPQGFVAVTPDGTIIPRPMFAVAAREARRAATSMATALVIGLLLILPARLLRLLDW